MRKPKGFQQILFFILFLILFFITSNCYSVISADTNAVAYFPMQVGNIYVYEYQYNGVTSSNRRKAAVLKDTVFPNHHKYYKLSNFPGIGGQWNRVDSLTGSLYSYSPNPSCSYYSSDAFIDSLAALPGNQIHRCGIPVQDYYKCSSISGFTLGNLTSSLKNFAFSQYIPPPPPSPYGTSIYSTISYAKGVGVYSYTYSSSTHLLFTLSTYTLRGCVIGGIVYGDTSMTPVKIINLNTITPEQFSLSQNFPNPFNPTTNITFDLPQKSFVKLKIYDVTEKELISLVNEDLTVGSYNFQWDASSFTSGVYFYRLETNDFIETKRMVLMK